MSKFGFWRRGRNSGCGAFIAELGISQFKGSSLIKLINVMLLDQYRARKSSISAKTLRFRYNS